MKSIVHRLTGPLLAAAWLGLTAAAQAAAGAGGTTSADREFAAFETLADIQQQTYPEEAPESEQRQWLDAYLKKIYNAGLALHDKYPQDPRWWKALVTVTTHQPLFLVPAAAGQPEQAKAQPVRDEAARAAWRVKIVALKAEMMAAPGVPVELCEKEDWYFVAESFGKYFADPRARPSVETCAAAVAGYHQAFQAHLAKYGALDEAMGRRAKTYLSGIERFAPDRLKGECEFLAGQPSAGAREVAQKRLAVYTRLTQPVEMAFTATDGRAVDLKQLRGKVVLVDFWATWCGPCKAELPNVKKVYEAYHAKGFEVVGVSLENPNFAPKDTPEQHAAKLAKGRQALDRFTAAHGLPWPQYYDGQWWDNEIAALYSIHSIPAMFLLDQDGRIVSTTARGEQLEAEVKRLLKI